MKILFIGVNPKDQRQLRLQDEINILEDIIDSQPSPKKFDLKVRNAATKQKMINLIRKYRPNILHISGHGNDDGTIIFEDSNGHSDIVYIQNLGELLDDYSGFIKCVVLSSCYSLNNLENFSENIKYTIGMKIAVGNSKALEFSKSFYEELVIDTKFERSFEIARKYIDLSEEMDKDILRIIIRESNNSSSVSEPEVNWILIILIAVGILIIGFILYKEF